ncbi:MAG: hypothetical protein EZS28_021798 [Streblomastix strix]|uniref:Uncharacterized protein n=1 Tax=Streblomastix strix TaxID=222440 RepID=A0A5J4VK15_9EUKA|nr:MAG: hypothetical protein EZS28_021798 [Streblomastix strix]
MSQSFRKCELPCLFGHKDAQGPVRFFLDRHSGSTDRQGPDKEPMSHNDPEQTKAQLSQAKFGENNLDLRSGDTKRKYRIIIKNLLNEDFRKNLLAASGSLVSKLEKRTWAQQVAEMALNAKIKLEFYSQQSNSIDLTNDVEQSPNYESSSQQTQSASRKRFRKETIKTMMKQIGEDLGVDMSKWKQFNYMEKPLKPTNTIEQQRDDRVRRQLIINPTANADRQYGAIGGNTMCNSGTGDQVMEPNIPRAQAEWRMEENSRLQNVEQRDYSQTLQDDRCMRHDSNDEKGRLDVNTGYDLGFQPYKNQLTTATISSLLNIRSQLHASGNAIWDQYSTIHIRENNTTNSKESEQEV